MIVCVLNVIVNTYKKYLGSWNSWETIEKQAHEWRASNPLSGLFGFTLPLRTSFHKSTSKILCSLRHRFWTNQEISRRKTGIQEINPATDSPDCRKALCWGQIICRRVAGTNPRRLQSGLPASAEHGGEGAARPEYEKKALIPMHLMIWISWWRPMRPGWTSVKLFGWGWLHIHTLSGASKTA